MNARLPGTVSDYLGAFERISSILPGHQSGWLHEARKAALERFVHQGFPSQHDEDWKYTNVAAIEHGRFCVLSAPSHLYLSAQVNAHALPGAHLLVFVNGRLEPGLCRTGRLQPGVVLGSLGYILEQKPDGLDETLLLGNATTTSPFADLNLSFMADGAYIRLPPGTVIKAPIQILCIASEANLAIQPRHLVLAAADSSATLIEQHVATSETSYFTNTVTHIALGPGASIEHYKLQQESPSAFHIAEIEVSQGANSHFSSGSFALGARLARTGINVALRAEGAVCDLIGLYLADGRQHLDHHTRIDHLQPRGTSREFYKGVLSGASRGVFNGRVVVHPDAQGSDAFQANHNLLLSENAEIDTKPQLEIWADDVKCSHGATVGQLDEEQVFYLRTRGMAQGAARALLTRAFAREVVDRVRLPALQEKLDAALQEKLPQQEGIC